MGKRWFRVAGLVGVALLATFQLHERVGFSRALRVSLPIPSAAPEPRDPCPLQTPEAWQKFLESHSAHDKWGETCEDSTCDKEFYEFVDENIQKVLDTCGPFLERHANIARCTENFRKYVPTWMLQHNDFSYGFTVDNHSYLTAQEAADKPIGMMTPPPAIIAAIPDRARVEEAARKGGLHYLTHDSAIDGTRTFVFNPDPQGRFDQWLLLNLKADPSAVLADAPLSILSVQKKDARGRLLPKVRLHFRDYQISPSGNGFELSLNESSSGKCYACHSNGVRQLIARRTKVLFAKPSRGEPGFVEEDDAPPNPDFGYRRLMEFNRKLRSYGSPDWEGKVIIENHGPVLGKAQGCTDCHDGKSRGVLTVTTSVEQLEKKIYRELSMPYDNNLQRLIERLYMENPPLGPKEADALRKAFGSAEKLTVDFYNSRLPELRKWLLQTPCR